MTSVLGIYALLLAYAFVDLRAQALAGVDSSVAGDAGFFIRRRA